MFKFISNLQNGVKRLIDRTGEIQQEVAFAEANAPEFIDGYSENRPAPEEDAETPQKLLVVGNEGVFPEDIINYGLDMARRMSFEIVALNYAPISNDTLGNCFSASGAQLCNDFKMQAESNASAFKERAEKYGIPFTHVVKFADSEKAVSEAIKECGPVEFVVSDNSEPSVKRSEAGDRLTNDIYVYSMLT